MALKNIVVILLLVMLLGNAFAHESNQNDKQHQFWGSALFGYGMGRFRGRRFGRGYGGGWGGGYGGMGGGYGGYGWKHNLKSDS